MHSDYKDIIPCVQALIIMDDAILYIIVGADMKSVYSLTPLSQPFAVIFTIRL